MRDRETFHILSFSHAKSLGLIPFVLVMIEAVYRRYLSFSTTNAHDFYISTLNHAKSVFQFIKYSVINRCPKLFKLLMKCDRSLAHNSF